MRVGIVSCYYHHNYGSMLQAYATQQIIERLGHQAVTIQCNAPIHYMTQSKLSYYLHKIENLDIVRTKVRKAKSKISLLKNKDIKDKIAVRSQFFDEFSKRYFRLSGMCKDREALTRQSYEFDVVVVGSDMLWHPVNIEHDFYTLTFVPDTIKKVSYATSFGTTIIPPYQKECARDFLNRFSFISVREQSGVEVVERLGVKKDIQVVLDPTLLFTADEWRIIQKEEPFIEGSYIFCYFLGVNQMHREIANRIKEKTGYKIAALQHLDEYIPMDEGFGDIKPYNVGPGEFVNLIRHAAFVCTDSFHGTCFSILNHRKFATFNRFIDGNSQSTNTRIDSLLSIVGLENRRVTGSLSDKQLSDLIDREIDYDNVDYCLNSERKKSVEFLQKALF